MNDYLLYTSLLIGIISLFVACFAITGYIRYRDQSIPPSAEKKKNNTINLVEGQKDHTFTIDLDEDDFIVKIHFNHSMTNNDIASITVDGATITNDNVNTSSSGEMVVSFNVSGHSLKSSITVTVTLVNEHSAGASSGVKGLASKSTSSYIKSSIATLKKPVLEGTVVTKAPSLTQKKIDSLNPKGSNKSVNDIFTIYVFYNSKLNLSKWDMSSVTSLDYMFLNFSTSKACTIDLSDWDVGKVTSLDYMFYYFYLPKNSVIDLSGWKNLNSNIDVSKMFTNNSFEPPITLNLTGWSSTYITTIQKSNSKLTIIS